MAGVPVVFSEVLNVSMKSEMRTRVTQRLFPRPVWGVGRPAVEHTRWPRRQEVACGMA